MQPDESRQRSYAVCCAREEKKRALSFSSFLSLSYVEPGESLGAKCRSEQETNRRRCTQLGPSSVVFYSQEMCFFFFFFFFFL